MKQGKRALLQLTAIFIAGEILFNYIMLKNGDDDLLGAVVKTCYFLLFIQLFSRKLTWAKWVLSISLILYGVMCLVIGFELMSIFYLIGAYNIFFGIFLHTSTSLSVFHNDDLQIDEPDSDIPKQHYYIYPTLLRRYKALLIDVILVFSVLITIMLLVEGSDQRTPIMVSSVLIMLLTYEPFLTAYSRTIGQRLMKIRVGRRDDPTKKITLLNAYIRWATKAALGWISFITITFNPEKRAIHDFASNSVMTVDE